MNIKEIRDLAKLFNNAGLNVLEVCSGEEKLRLEKAPYVPYETKPACAPCPETDKTAVGAGEKNLSGEVDFNNIKEIKSPMVGVFYRAPAEESKPFIEIGDSVKKGDVLCIIEAMKLMNEICAEVDGEVVDICAENGQIVEYEQTIFKIF